MSYNLVGSYYEACNCEAICPCRRQDGAPGGRSTYGICQFLLSWQVTGGASGEVDLSDLAVVMAGFYDDDEDGSPWRVMLFVDEKADEKQFAMLSEIFLGRAGGDVAFTSNIVDVADVRTGRIILDHASKAESIMVGQAASASVVRNVEHAGTVSCGIPGHGWPGQESVSAVTVAAAPFEWSYEARCGFAAGFHYRG